MSEMCPVYIRIELFVFPTGSVCSIQLYSHEVKVDKGLSFVGGCASSTSSHFAPFPPVR